MAGKKKPKEEHGYPVTIRLKKREIKELDEFTNQCNFENRTDLIKWSLQLSNHVFKGDIPEMIIQLQRFTTQPHGEITDPRQKDIFQEFQMESAVTMNQAILDAKHQLQEKAKNLVQS